jgi:hypothetical protein
MKTEIENKTVIANYDKCPAKAFLHVHPRYSGGSPALVADDIALHVADDEISGYEQCLSGILGDKAKEKAAADGLGGIVYARWEKGNKVYRMDLITGELIIEPPRLGWKDKERAAALLNKKKYLSLRMEEKFELERLEFSAKIHRETL